MTKKREKTILRLARKIERRRAIRAHEKTMGMKHDPTILKVCDTCPWVSKRWERSLTR